jgi:prepilin-type N-terminal cleavage/methylation domain-containing protein
MHRLAFTLLELVFVIIIIGILAVMAMPNFMTNPLQQATEQMAGHIRYTQHLAMVDDKYDPNNSTWFASNWQIWFRIFQGKYYYEVFSDKDKEGNSDAGEEAIDPLTHRNLGNGDNGVGLPDNNDINITNKYGITQMSFSANCRKSQGGKIVFDHLGRPYGDVSYDPNDPYYKHLIQPCVLELTHGGDNKTATITIQPETGYVSVVYN